MSCSLRAIGCLILGSVKIITWYEPPLLPHQTETLSALGTVKIRKNRKQKLPVFPYLVSSYISESVDPLR